MKAELLELATQYRIELLDQHIGPCGIIVRLDPTNRCYDIANIVTNRLKELVYKASLRHGDYRYKYGINAGAYCNHFWTIVKDKSKEWIIDLTADQFTELGEIPLPPVYVSLDDERHRNRKEKFA